MSFISTPGLIVFIIDILITSMLVLILLKKYFETKILAVAILSGFFLLDLAAIVIEFPNFLKYFDNPAEFYLMEGNPFDLFFSMLGILSAGLFLLFINYFEKDRISVLHSIVYIAFLSTFGVFVFFNLFFNIGDINLGNTPISFEFLPVFFLTYVLVISLRSLFRMKKQSQDPNQLKQINLMIIAIIFYYVNTSIFITLGNNIDHLLSPNTTVLFLHILPRVSVIVGDFALFYAYALARVAFLQMQRMEKLMVINKSGLPLLSYDFIEVLDSDSTNVLLSGGLTAILQLFRETMEVSDIEMIQFKEKQVLVSQFDNIGAFLIVDQPTSFLREALRRFNLSLISKYDLSGVQDKKFKEIRDNKLVKSSFGL